MVSMVRPQLATQPQQSPVLAALIGIFSSVSVLFTSFLVVLIWQINFWLVAHFLPGLTADWAAYTHDFPLSLVAFLFALIGLTARIFNTRG